MSDLTTALNGPILELGGFRLLSVLGEGSFATAYMAQQIGTEREAVLKVAHPHLIRGPYGDMIRQRFDAEVRAITRIQHPNMVTVYTSGLTPQGIPYIAMELVQGHTLDYRLRHAAPLRRDVVLTLFEQVASVLKSAHSMGVVHRDIAPNNIMIQEDEQDRLVARVLDFGFAMLDEKHSHTVGSIGTPRYLAPEQLNGRAVALRHVQPRRRHVVGPHRALISGADLLDLRYLSHLQRPQRPARPAHLQPRRPARSRGSPSRSLTSFVNWKVPAER